MNRAVTERDIRLPEFKDAKLEDLEFRDDGRVVRKDRWEMGVRRIASAVGLNARESWEIGQVVVTVAELVKEVGMPGDPRMPEGVLNRLAELEPVPVYGVNSRITGYECPACGSSVEGAGLGPDHVHHTEDCPAAWARKQMEDRDGR